MGRMSPRILMGGSACLFAGIGGAVLFFPQELASWAGLGASASLPIQLLAGGFLGVALNLDRGTGKGTFEAEVEINGALNHDGATAGFFGVAPVTQRTGTPVDSTGIHQALVDLGLIT